MNCSSRRWLNRLVVWLVKAKGFQQCGCPVCRSLESKLTVVERCLVPSIIATRVKKLAINKLAIDERMVVQNNSGSFLVRIPHELHDDTSICGTKNYTVGASNSSTVQTWLAIICRNCSASVECDAYQSIQTACRFGAGIECRSWAFLRLRFAGKSPKIGLGLDRG